MAAPVAEVQISEQAFREAEVLLSRIPLELRTNVLDKAMRGAAHPVALAAQQLAPSSVKTGTRKKWSKKVRYERAGTPEHHQTIGYSTVRSYGPIVAIYVGPLWRSGVLINVIGHEHAQVLWGRHTGVRLPGTGYLKEASQTTLQEQQLAFEWTIQKNVERIVRKLSRGG